MRHISITAPDMDSSLEVYVEARAYPTETAAREAWERINAAHIPDVGASRVRDSRDPKGPGRFVIGLAFNPQAWDSLEALGMGGSPWDPEEWLVMRMIAERIARVVRGEQSWSIRGEDPKD